MAIYPRATVRLLPENQTQAKIRPTQFIFHSAVPGGESLYNFWLKYSNLESHFYVNYKGTVEQYMDTEVRADANRYANRRPDGTGAISVETQDNRDPDNDPWTVRQLEELIAMGRWCADTHGIPRRICRHADDPGFGWHVMFGAPGPWTPAAGKTCPGRIRIKQLKEVVLPAIFTGTTTAPPPEEDMPLTDNDIARIADAVWAREFRTFRPGHEATRASAEMYVGARDAAIARALATKAAQGVKLTDKQVDELVGEFTTGLADGVDIDVQITQRP